MKIKFCCILLLGSFAASASNVTQINRYATVENKPMAAQINPLLTIQRIHFPKHITTVGEAITYWVQYSGYHLSTEAKRPNALKDVMHQPLPQVVRFLGPLSVQDGLIVLAGMSVFSLQVDVLHREVNFKLKGGVK